MCEQMNGGQKSILGGTVHPAFCSEDLFIISFSPACQVSDLHVNLCPLGHKGVLDSLELESRTVL